MDWIIITLIVLIVLCIIHSKTSINNQNEYIVYSNYQTADLMDKITEYFSEDNIDETLEEEEQKESQFKKDMGETAIVVATDLFGMRKKTPEKLQLERKIKIAKIEADNAKQDALTQQRKTALIKHNVSKL